MSQQTTVVYYFPVDGEHKETGEVCPVRLTSDGLADLSALPLVMRSSLENFGTPDRFHRHVLYPKDGSTFLLALVNNASGYRRFRTSPDLSAPASKKPELARIIPIATAPGKRR